MNRSKWFLLSLLPSLAVLAFGLEGCNSKKKKNKGIYVAVPEEGDKDAGLKKKEDKKKKSGKPVKKIKETESLEDLLGVWEGQCEKMGEESTRVTLEFTEKKLIATLQDFIDTDCNEKWTTNVLESLYVAKEKDELNHLDIQVDRILVTLYERSDVSHANKRKECGKDDWKRGEEVDVTELDCGDRRPVSKGSRGYDIFKIDGDVLQTGIDPLMDEEERGDLGKSEENRPKKLAEYKYTKK